MSDQKPIIDNLSASPVIAEAYLTSHPWVRNYETGVPATFHTPGRSLASLLDDAARTVPTRTAMLYYGVEISYARFASLANRFALSLIQQGLKTGDRVAISLPNIPQYPIAFYGALKAGAIVVPTNPLYTEHELQHQLADAQARFLIMLDSFYPTARAIRKDTVVEQIILTNPADYLPPLLKLLFPLSQRGAQNPQPSLTQDELRQDPTLHKMSTLLLPSPATSVEEVIFPEVQEDSIAILQYTGGTTGLAKGAILTHANLYANAIQTRLWMPGGQTAQESSLCVAPFFHAYGMTVGMNLSIYSQATMILLPRFKAKDVVKAIRKHKPTLFPGIPTMYIAIMKELQRTKMQADFMRSIKYCISGAAPLPRQVQDDFEALTGGKLVEGYGLSEAAPVTHCNPLTEKRRNGSIGLPFPGIEAALMNSSTGELVPAGETGELVIKGPNVMQGYWNSPEETIAALKDGWLHTGDIGRMDEDGFFYIIERAKDMIIASGFNVYPREVEEVLFKHPAVSEAAVVGVTDPYRGETVAAFIILKAEFQPDDKTKQSILDFCRQHLTPYKIPRHLEFRPTLPKSLIGKVLRRELRNEYQKPVPH